MFFCLFGSFVRFWRFGIWLLTSRLSILAARVNLNSEVLSNMKIIKLQSWEESFKERILHLRSVELQTLFDYLIGRSLSSILWTFTPLLVSLATFAAYVWSGHQLDVASSLTALALFEVLRFPLFMLPQIINNCIEAMVAVTRVQSFLLCEEHKSIGPGTLQENGISMTNVSAAYDSKKMHLFSSMTKPNDEKSKELVEQQWQAALLQSQLEAAEREIRRLRAARGGSASGVDARDDFTAMEASAHSMISDNNGGGNLLCLKRVNFACRPGELVAVVGGVGCGKSSLLNAILGEVRLLNGQMQAKGRLAYFSQSPFIMNATVRDNIIFGHGYADSDETNNQKQQQQQQQHAVVDEDLYQRALACCALKHDLELLPDGDLTEIGEKGITLSGGQKARIALARAVYHAAAITLVDDALSAVDAHVAKTLFEEAISTELLRSRNGEDGKRSVILVTNALQFLNHPRVDRIVVVQDGLYHRTGELRGIVIQQ
jgi:ATP-binding cassette, subfamily C (CFTR/MRP), member 1